EYFVPAHRHCFDVTLIPSNHVERAETNESTMRRIPCVFLFFILVSGRTAFAQTPELSSYKLGSGDTISVRVLGEDDLKRERVRLSDAGTLSFPVLGEIRVKGMTVGALEQHITSGLKGRYLLNPQVTVS